VRVADRDDELPDAQALCLAQAGSREVAFGGAEYRQVG
jgi:hypothetical protein